MKTLLALALAFLVFQGLAQDGATVVRVRALEVVDDRGVVRARLGLKGSDVIELDLFDRQGTIRVKLGAGSDASGLVMGDGTEPTPIHLLAQNKPGVTHITLKAPGGKEHIIRP